MYGAGDVRVENVPDSIIKLPTDALVRITSSCICGSDLWPYGSMKPEDGPARMGHEFIGVVEDTGSEVTTVKRGDLVVAPFAVSDNTCPFLPRGSAHLLRPPAGELLGRRAGGGRPGRSGPRPARRRHPRQAPRRPGLRLHPVPADAHGRPRHRLPRRRRGRRERAHPRHRDR
ncbi:alcohol dehydrogenase catalytic domain-containing protein [Streptomyces capitiformicae]|uniref:Alcohol dehydrogenase-like N-terminal domain-containing protein n=1 Tax=Streptomyces capitiformicae TaxID=2014920 RepID=A0A918ZTQ3_9ACTN|nr:hypothetical protein GCM10017771_93350 [Streptomyces capitiformicae]